MSTKSSFFVILLLSFYTVITAQEKVERTIYDIGTREPLENVLVRPSNTGMISYTNSDGLFSIYVNTSKKQSDHLDVVYSALSHTIINNTGNELWIRLVSVDGRLVFSDKMGKKELELPFPESGTYILIIKSKDREEKYFLNSDGLHFSVGEKVAYSLPQDSSLFFSKENYYNREILLSDKKSMKKVELLKKSYQDLDYFEEIIDYRAFEMLQSSPPVTNYGEVKSIKAVYDFVKDKIYYINVKKHEGHYLFAKNVLGFPSDNSAFFQTQYCDNPKRFLYCAIINYYVNIDKYVLEFGPYDILSCDEVTETFQKILSTSNFGDKLYFYPSNPRWNDCPNVPMITSEELYEGQNYQALSVEEAYGYLRKVDINDLSQTYLGRHDILLTNGIPNTLSVISGIITTDYQTPLSHINILSHSRKTPNMALIDGWTNPLLDSLLGKLVYLKVGNNSFEIRVANLEEATDFWFENEPHTPVTLDLNTDVSGLINLENQNIESVNFIGGKAANFAELVHLDSIPLPENYFAIPFYYYQQHIEHYGIDTILNQLLLDEEFYSDMAYREEKLNGVKDLIMNSPIDTVLLQLVREKIHDFSDFSSYRFRSSTNAEDLPGFSGAGLYDSFSAKKNHSTKTIENAIKKVWASLWNMRAFDERQYFLIDQNSIAMGILVHRSFPDEDANGVIVTKNLYNVNRAFTINVQYKDYSIVFPEPGIMHDQILIYTFSLDSTNYSIQYLSHSNISALNGGTVLSDQELFEIADYCSIIKSYYYENIEHNCQCEFDDFAVDIEFKVDSQVENRKIYFKQARIYLSN